MKEGHAMKNRVLAISFMSIACAVANAATPTITPGTMKFRNFDYSSDVRIAFDLEGEPGIVTLEIATIVWMHNICNRIGNELKRRQIDYSFSASDFWLWGVLGTLIIVGPFVFAHKFFKSVNLMNDSFNRYG